jgi:hypothetical protein
VYFLFNKSKGAESDGAAIMPLHQGSLPLDTDEIPDLEAFNLKEMRGAVVLLLACEDNLSGPVL